MLKHFSLVRFGLALMCGAVLAGAPLNAQSPAPDNTKTNARDRQPTQKTAGDQKNTRSDLETTRQIRRAIVGDKSLSSYAHNLKIVTAGGKVTLKGPVRTEAEKATVEAKAADVAGKENVMSQVSITDKPGQEPSHKPSKKGQR
jgi:hyperosmotically inducible protein